MGTKIKDAELISKISGEERIPVSDGSGNPKAVRINQVGLIEVTYDELVALRDNGKLIAGMMYRMTDYETTTSQEGTQAAGHPFDLILTALDEKTLDEKCSAIQSARDTEGYFANSNLPAWQVWYSLDNDGSRFGWAVYPIKKISVDVSNTGAGAEPAIGILNGTFEYGGTTYTRWDATVMGIECYFLTSSESVNIGDVPFIYIISNDNFFSGGSIISFQSITSKGKGVIFRLVDEKRNDLPYDFKNIMFTRKTTNGNLDTEGGTDTLVYTFNYYENSVCKDYTNTKLHMCSGNYMVCSESLPNNVFLSKENSYCSNNTFGYKCYNNTFGSKCYENSFGDNCYNNTFGNECRSNTFGNECYENSFGRNCYENSFGNKCQGNSFGNSFYRNTFGGECTNNTFRNTCRKNTFGNECRSNTFGDNCYRNTFGSECTENSFEYECRDNTFENDCRNNTFGHECIDNIFKHSCKSNTLEYKSISNIFGVGCNNNIIGASNTRNIELKNNVIYIKLLANGSGSNKDYAQNYEIKGISGTSSSPVEITLTRNNEFTTYISKSSNGDIIQYTDEDIYNAINK